MTVNKTPVKIHWMRHDLRVFGNQALFDLCADEATQIIVVYVFDPSQLQEGSFGFKRLGEYRQAFLQESLQQVDDELGQLNIPFLCLSGNGVTVLSKLITQLDVKEVSVEHHSGLNERREVSQIRSKYPSLTIHERYSNTLFSPSQLPFDVKSMPDVFSPFRRKIEKSYEVEHASTRPNKRGKVFVPSIDGYERYCFSPLDVNTGYTGGHKAATERIKEYFYTNLGLSSYKETRNGLDGWDFSSRLSAFLALGCISPREVYYSIKKYEAEHGANDSTYWLFFELLWREFFQWQACKQDAEFFRFQGIQPDVKLSNRHDADALQMWIDGETGYPIVDACMKQLAQTGWMSNRGRQLVASCFVHELNLDWRYGAAYFEEQLVDFDAASNYGNWLYLAGVGSDPRGHRQFNLAKQTEIYDPKQQFINKWLS